MKCLINVGKVDTETADKRGTHTTAIGYGHVVVVCRQILCHQLHRPVLSISPGEESESDPESEPEEADPHPLSREQARALVPCMAVLHMCFVFVLMGLLGVI